MVIVLVRVVIRVKMFIGESCEIMLVILVNVFLMINNGLMMSFWCGVIVSVSFRKILNIMIVGMIVFVIV